MGTEAEWPVNIKRINIFTSWSSNKSTV